MEDKRTTFAVLLCIVVVIFYSELFIAPYTRPAQTPAVTQSEGQVGVTSGQQISSISPSSSPVSGATTPQAVGNSKHPSPADLAAAPETVIESDLLGLTITHRGARLRHARLSSYKSHLDAPATLDLVTTIDNGPLPLAIHTGGQNDDHVLYTLASVQGGTPRPDGGYAVPHNGSVVAKFTGTLTSGTPITKTITLKAGSYLVDVDVELGTPPTDGSRIWLEWSHFEPALQSSQFELKGFTFLSENKLQHKLLTDTPVGLQEVGTTQWSTFGDRYFIAALIPSVTGINTRIGSERIGDSAIVYLTQVSGQTQQGSFKVFIGPKDFKVLQSSGYELFRTVDLGWFSFLAHPMLALLRFLHSLFGNWGLAIVALTLIIKAAFLPLMTASFKSMAQMQEIQPEVKALRERISDPTQLNQALMNLYKQRGINPLGGCLPVLIQIPVFLGLYNALVNAIELRHAPFALWIRDLSAPESLDVFGFGIPVMVILMGISMFVQQLKTPSTMDPTQKKIMLAMPVLFTFFFLGFPSGLTLYWLVNNVISIVQQLYIKGKDGQQKSGPFAATMVTSIGIFAFCYVITLL